MSIRKRNEFLEGNESEEELDNGYESEKERGRGDIGRASKRRRTDSESEVSVGDLEAEGEVSAILPKPKDARFDFSKFSDGEEEEHAGDEQDDNDEERTDHDRIKPDKERKSSATKQYEAAQKAVRKSGVVYISRVPPFMKPQTLKHFLEPHARKGIGRIFLTPEDHVAHTKRVKSGGNKKKSFTDGWVEFNSKNEAKLAAETLNGNIIGGKKGNFYHDDLWNMKYLKGFKWHHLTEQISNENAERAARINAEIRKARKENKAFVEDVERAKMLEGMEGKARRKKEREGGTGAGGEEDVFKKPKRDFRQHKVRETRGREDMKPAREASGALSKIF